MTKTNIDTTSLCQQWVHSHEEDSETETVFRPTSFPLPRSRGRTAFILKPDGGLVEVGIGPTDRHQETQGTWKLGDDGTLFFYERKQTKPKRAMKIISVNKDRLALKR